MSVWSTTWKNIRRTPYQALAVILVLLNTFAVGYMYSLLFFGSEFMLRYFETRPQVVAFFQLSATDESMKKVEEAMKAKPYVDKVTLTTKDQALASYRKDNEKDPLLAELVTADVFPASVEVSGKDVQSLAKIQEDLSQFETEIEEVVYQKDVVDALGQWTSKIRIMGIILISVLSLTSLLVISTIVGMKIGAKKPEIAIMRLLGATNGYIAMPFIMEGMVYGVLGSLVAWVLTFTLLQYLTPWLLEFLGEIPLLPLPPTFIGLQLGIGLLIAAVFGIFASLLALRRVAR